MNKKKKTLVRVVCGLMAVLMIVGVLGSVVTMFAYAA